MAGEWRSAAEWGGYAYGEVVTVPAGTAGAGDPPRALIALDNNSYLFVEYVAPDKEADFFRRGVSSDARVLPVSTNAVGLRSRQLSSVLEASREEPATEMPAPRTVTWCLRHLVAEGRGLESHLEHVKTLCGLQHNQWGMEEYANLAAVGRALMCHDQVDPANLLGMELLFRRLQTIEYSYSDRLREKMANSSGSKLTLDEQAAFGAVARTESRLMVCPALLEQARTEVEKEAGLAKALLKAREARSSLAKKPEK